MRINIHIFVQNAKEHPWFAFFLQNVHQRQTYLFFFFFEKMWITRKNQVWVWSTSWQDPHLSRSAFIASFVYQVNIFLLIFYPKLRFSWSWACWKDINDYITSLLYLLTNSHFILIKTEFDIEIVAQQQDSCTMLSNFAISFDLVLRLSPF